MNGKQGFRTDWLDNLHEGVYFVAPDLKITFWNKGAETISGYGAEEVLGHGCWENIVSHVDQTGCAMCESQCILFRTLRDGLVRTQEAFLHHKSGHRVPVLIRVSALRDDGGRIVGGMQAFTDISVRMASEQRIKDLQEMAYIDVLTGIPNRRYMDDILSASLSELGRYGWEFGVLLMDLDDFKLVNDTCGHHVGDRALNMAAATLRNASRPSDVVGRWGGDEFLAVIKNVDEARLAMVAEKFRTLVEGSYFVQGGDRIRVRLSVGTAVASDGDSAEALLLKADRDLYRDKSVRCGRERLGGEAGSI